MPQLDYALQCWSPHYEMDVNQAELNQTNTTLKNIKRRVIWYNYDRTVVVICVPWRRELGRGELFDVQETKRD